jgi:hypothetical protein
VNEFEFAWLAGLLEGEGTFLKPLPSSPYLPIVRLNMTDRDVVERAARLLGSGVCSYTPKNPRHKINWIASVKGARACDLMLQLRPFMGDRRRRQIDEALAASGSRPRGDGPKLSLLQARAIRERFAAGESAVSLAAEFGVSKWLVYRIKEGKRAS